MIKNIRSSDLTRDPWLKRIPDRPIQFAGEIRSSQNLPEFLLASRRASEIRLQIVKWQIHFRNYRSACPHVQIRPAGEVDHSIRIDGRIHCLEMGLQIL